MVNPLRSSAIIVLVQAPTTCGWIPRFLASGVRTSPSGSSSDARRHRVLLSASNVNDDSIVDDDSDRLDDHDRDSDSQPLFAEADHVLAEVDHVRFISRLEAIYDIDVEDFFIDDTDGRSQRLLDEGERVVLADWMEWEEGPCYGDSCGDDGDQCDIPEEYKVAAPKVDVMSFLGIRRAEPLQVQRDWD
ncbi:hypothetical protein ACHAXR_010866 [Thalassiosira sp. AJA248-18]